MPVLTTEQEFDTWLDGSVNDAIALQRPLPNELLHIVATGEKSDRVLADE
jgi:putative SOS response-associated peptidase YedK